MDFTFGIITNSDTLNNISLIINSIKLMNINNYEIIIVGGCDIIGDNIKHIKFDKSDKISIKKNLITDNSKYENIVYLHDYIIFESGWYDGFLKFGNDFDVCMTKIVNIDGSRYRDWCLWKDDGDKYVEKLNYLIPYNISHISNMMYISGAYWVAKRKFMIDNRLNEKLKWGQGEDVEWSIRSRQKTNFKMNTLSSVNMMKYKDPIFKECTISEIYILNNIDSYDDSESYDKLTKNHISKWI